MNDVKMPEHVREFFRKQGKIGAKKRSANLAPERRKEIAQLAARARWANKTEVRGPKGK